jgi:soluble lytic murein transglycosylase-like protein
LKTLAILVVCYACVSRGEQAGAAIEKQRASVRRQIRANAPPTGFFTTPWVDASGQPPLAQPAGATPIPELLTGDCEPVAEAALSKLILQASQREHVDVRIIRAIIQRESGAKPCAVSPKGAQGLMQLMPATQVDLGVKDAFDPESNVDAGVRYFKQMLDRYSGNVGLALAAYNAGPQRVAAGGKIPDIPETQAYVMSILGQLNEDDPTAVK